jgi:fermentation-respiration switch protein FrsA (DUF1100 family)
VRGLVAAVIVIIIVLAALYAYATMVRRSSMFVPEKYPAGQWEEAETQFHPREVWFNATDGVRLNGWLFASGDAKAPLIIWCHGNGGNISERALIAEKLRRHNVDVLLFDWRGYGKSDGTPTESHLYRDVEAAYAFATHELHKRPEDVVSYGESLGGPYAAWLAMRQKVRCVIIENSFPSLRDLGNTLYAPVPLGYFAPCSMTTTRWLNKAGVPVLVMHGKRDQVIPFPLGMRLYDDLRVPKEMLVSETAGHSEIPFAEGERYYETVAKFVRGE